MMDGEMDARIIWDKPLTVDFMLSPLPLSYRHQSMEDFLVVVHKKQENLYVYV